MAENSLYFKKLAGVCSRFSVSLEPKVCPVLTNIALGVVSFFRWHFVCKSFLRGEAGV